MRVLIIELVPQVLSHVSDKFVPAFVLIEVDVCRILPLATIRALSIPRQHHTGLVGRGIGQPLCCQTHDQFSRFYGCDQRMLNRLVWPISWL